MNDYFRRFIEALSSGNVERRTDLNTGNEAIFQNGHMIAATDHSLSYSSPDITETVKAEPHLVLFGAGHIGKALYDLGVLQKMRMTVLDDRAELLTEERFPEAERHIGSFEELLAREYDVICPSYVIFTHGHSHDTDCLRYTLRHSSSYIGMIGSKAKSKKALEQLREEGFSDEALASVHTPVGLPIGAETPEEIAISIMAEIISVFRSGEGFTTVDPDLLKILSEKSGMVIRIIRKNGSAPRATGTMMFVDRERTYGTIGGGNIEKEAIAEARKALVLGTSTFSKEYNLTAHGDIGMVCGGNETLLFSKI